MKQVIVVRKDLKLSKGKLAVQCCHASLEAFKIAANKCLEKVSEWEQTGLKKVVLYIENEKELLDLYEKIPKKIPKKIITDAGLTQIPPGTVTCIGIGPYDAAELDKYTGKLKLVS